MKGCGRLLTAALFITVVAAVVAVVALEEALDTALPVGTSELCDGTGSAVTRPAVLLVSVVPTVVVAVAALLLGQTRTSPQRLRAVEVIWLTLAVRYNNYHSY